MQGERTLPDLLKDAAAAFSEIVRNEVRLARTEAMENVRGMSGGVMRAAIGVALGGAAATLLLIALAALLSELMPVWLGALIAALVGAGVAYALVKSGMKAAAQQPLNLPRTASSVSRDVQVIKENVTP